jgi:hypothetical protein
MLVSWPRAAHGYSIFLLLFYFVDFDTHFLDRPENSWERSAESCSKAAGGIIMIVLAPPGESGGFWAVCWLFSVLRGGKKMKSLLGLPWTLISGAFFLFVFCVSISDGMRRWDFVSQTYMRGLHGLRLIDGFYAIHEASNEMGAWEVLVDCCFWRCRFPNYVVLSVHCFLCE